MSHLSAIVYTSQTGFTRRYAEMLAQKTGLPACELGDPVLPAFYLRGGYAPDRLTGPYKWAMSAMARMVTQNPPKDDQERAVQEAFRQGGDWVDEAYLDPVLDWLSRQG